MTDETLLALIQRGQTIAAFLVAIGVAGEFVGEFVSRPIQHRLDMARQNEVAQLQQTVAATNEHTAKIELDAVQQRERAAKAERDLLELQQQLAHRQLSTDARSSLIASLKAGPKGKLSLVATISDNEAVDFANQILTVLTEAGWQASGGVGPFSGRGLVLVSRSATLPAELTHLIHCFGSVGIPIGHQADPSYGDDTFSLMVLSK